MAEYDPNRRSTETMDNEGAEQAEGKIDEMKQGASEMRDKASEYGQVAQERIDENWGQAADTMEDAASKVRQRFGDSGAGETAASTMEKTASYVREHTTDEMLGDVEAYVREHPAQSVMGAVVAGFLLGRILR